MITRTESIWGIGRLVKIDEWGEAGPFVLIGAVTPNNYGNDSFNMVELKTPDGDIFWEFSERCTFVDNDLSSCDWRKEGF